LFLPKYKFRKDEFAHEIVEIPFINLPFLRFLTFNLFLMFYLLLKFNFEKPEVIYVRRMNSIVPSLYAKFSKAKFFYEINDDPYSKQIQEGSKAIFYLRSMVNSVQDRFNIKLCDKAFVITPALIDKILKMNPLISSEKFRVMESGANTDLFNPLDMAECRETLKLSLKPKIVGFAGTLLSHQGIDTLIKAAPAVIEKMPNVFFLVVGEGPQKKEWANLITANMLERHFFFAGQVCYHEMPTWLCATDICVAPYRRSAGYRSPVKIFDYMACGKAVIASKIQGTTEIFEDSGAVILVEPENPKALAESIVQVLKNKRLADNIGKRGRQLVHSKYDRKSLAKMIYAEALNAIES
jgi:glycosyltransferase involved in cell wall biosynthesis